MFTVYRGIKNEEKKLVQIRQSKKKKELACDVWADKIEADFDGILHKSVFVEIAHRQNGKEILESRGCLV